MKIGLLFVVLACAVVHGGNRAMYVQGAKYYQPATCSGNSVAWTSLKGACSAVTGLDLACCNETFEVSLPEIGDLCTPNCVSRFLSYWCTRGCSPSNACLPQTEVDALISACQNCRSVLASNGTMLLALPTNGSASELTSDTGLVLGATANATCKVGVVNSESAFPIYKSSVLQWNGVVQNVNTSGGPLTFFSPNGTLGVEVTVVSVLPPKATVSISLSDNVFPKVIVATQKSSFGLWKATTPGQWSQVFNFFVADVTAYSGKMEVLLNLINSAGQGTNSTIMTLVNSVDKSVVPTSSASNIEQCKNTNGKGELGFALLGQLLTSVNSVSCNCEFCGIYKTGQTTAELNTLTITQAADYYMWGSAIAVKTISIPSTLKTFALLASSRLIVRGPWTITQPLTFNGDGTDNRLVFDFVGLFSTQQVLTNNIRTEISSGQLTTGSNWLLRNKSKFIASPNTNVNFGSANLDVSSNAGIGDSSDPTVFIRSTSFLGNLLNIKGSGFATIGPQGKLEMPITLSNVGNPASATRSKLSVQQAVGSYPWNNFTVQVFATGGTVGKGNIVVGEGTAFNVDTTRSDLSVNTGGNSSILVSGDTSTSTTTMDVRLGGYLVFKNVGPASRPFNLRGPLILQTNSTVVAEVAANSAWSINFVQVSLFRFVVPAGGCQLSVYGQANKRIENCPVGRNCTFGIYNESSASGTACQLTLDMAATTTAATTTALSADTYSITIERDCDWTKDKQFERAIVEYFSERDLTYDNIVVLNQVCGSTTVNFKCRDTTISAADALCRSIVNFAENKNSPLNLALGVTTQKTHSPRGSDSGLFALYSLMFIPCCMACILIAVYKAKQKQADDQYLQDTATFSSLAHNKGPAPMPPPQGFQPAAPVYYPEQVYAPQPYPVAPPVYQTGYQPLPQGYPQAAPYGYA